MAKMTIKGTYSLDVPTVRALDRIARIWNVSKSEALRRAIRSAANRLMDEETDSLAALDELQSSLRLEPGDADDWARQSRQERYASSRRRAREGP